MTATQSCRRDSGALPPAIRSEGGHAEIPFSDQVLAVLGKASADHFAANVPEKFSSKGRLGEDNSSESTIGGNHPPDFDTPNTPHHFVNPGTPCVDRTRQCIELLVSYHASPSVRVRNQLVQLNIGLVRKTAHRVAYQCAEPYEDLEQTGYLGLIAAIERFDPTQGCAFSSFAVPYIRGEMLHFLRDRANSIKIPRRLQQLSKDGQKSRQDLTETLGRQPSDQEIAEHLNVSVNEWRASRLATKNRSPLSLDAAVNQQMDSPLTLGDTLLDARIIALQTLEEDHLQLQQALGQLEDKTREVIEFVFLNQLSRKEVAERIGISPMTVTRRIQRGVQQLVALLQPQILQIDPSKTSF